MTREQLLAELSACRYRVVRAYRDLRALTESIEENDASAARDAALGLEESIPDALDCLEQINDALDRGFLRRGRQ